MLLYCWYYSLTCPLPVYVTCVWWFGSVIFFVRSFWHCYPTFIELIIELVLFSFWRMILQMSCYICHTMYWIRRKVLTILSEIMSMYAIKKNNRDNCFTFNKLKQTQNIQVDFSSRVTITADGLISLVP